MTARELLHHLPDLVRPEALQGVTATVQYDIDPPVHQRVQDGAVTTHDGPAEAPDVAIRISDEDLGKLFRGELNPAVALMTGRVRIRGDVRLAQRLASSVDRDRLAALS